MGIFVELVVQLVFEILLPVFAELLVEIGFGNVFDWFAERVAVNLFLKIVGYALLGFVIGGLSLLIFPQTFVRSENFHGISLLITPLAAGAILTTIDWLRQPSSRKSLRFNTFGYAFLFAFCMALVRFIYAV